MSCYKETACILEALNNGLIVPDPGVDLSSINNLLSVVYVTCYTNITDNFSYELCQSAMDTFVHPIGDKKPTEAKTIIDLPIVVEPLRHKIMVICPLWWCPLWWSPLRHELSLVTCLLRKKMKAKFD